MSKGGNIVGSGYKIQISPEYDTQSAEERRDAAWKRDPGLQRSTRPWGDVLTVGWGQAVYNWLKSQGDNADGTTKYNVHALATLNDGGKIFQVPNREHYDVGRMHNDALYVQVTVYPDLEDLARQDAERAQQATAARLLQKQQELDDANANAKIADADRKIALAQGQAGGGIQAIEITVWNNGKDVFVAKTPGESMASDGPHPGLSIIDPGAWQKLYGSRAPSGGKAVLSWQGGTTVIEGTGEVASLQRVAQGNGSPLRVKMAQGALDYAGIGY